jgi:methionyl-tRNA synthetase
MGKFYVTTAIDYVNAAPHIGHAYEKIAADILARYHRLKGDDVFFLTGVDEHGSKVEKAAKQANIAPLQFCDQMAAQFKTAWDNLNLSYDHFFRTTSKDHYQSVTKIFNILKAKGDIYKDSYKGLYCDGCEDFKRPRDLDDDGNCPNHKKPPFMYMDENYFFRLSKYKAPIRQWLLANPDCVQPEFRLKEVLNQLDDEDLTDFSISRSRKNVNWGIPVPDDDEQVIYVWLDALTNYITGVGHGADIAKFAKYWPADVHLIGKDIVKFHAIYWPAFLLAADIPLPKRISVHGFLTVEGQKISKSIGNVIDPNALVAAYGADAVRFYLFAATSFFQDGDFSKHDFVKRVNADLANNLGNLLNRTLTLIERYCQGIVPAEALDQDLREEANSVHAALEAHLNNMEFAKALEAIFALVDQANKYLNDEKPWTLFKNEKVAEGEKVLYTALEILRRSAVSLYPFTPDLSEAIWAQLGFSKKISDTAPETLWDLIPPGQAVKNQGPIFKRLEEEIVVTP